MKSILLIYCTLHNGSETKNLSPVYINPLCAGMLLIVNVCKCLIDLGRAKKNPKKNNKKTHLTKT